MKITYKAIAACRGIRRIIVTDDEEAARCFAFMHDFTSNYTPTVQVLRQLTREEVVQIGCEIAGKTENDAKQVRWRAYELTPSLRGALIIWKDGSRTRVDSPSLVKGGGWEMLDLSDEIKRARNEWIRGQGSQDREMWLQPKL